MPVTLIGTGNIVQTFTTPNGSSASPGLRFDGSKTSGLYATGTNVGISANGIGKVVVASTGLVANGNVSAQYFVGDGSQLTNIVVPMTVSNIQITDASWTLVDDTAFSTTTNGYCLVNGTGFGPGSLVKFGTDWATSTVYVSSTQLRAQVPAKTSGTYDVMVIRGDTVTASLSLGATWSTQPVWSTSSVLATVYRNAEFSQTLSASSDSTVTYGNTSALPPQTTFSTDGIFSGNITSVEDDTLYTFTAKATDLELQDTSRTFSVQYIEYVLQKVVASDKASYDFLGYSVSMSSDGSRVLVGAYGSDPDTLSNAGAAYVFSLVGSTWTQAKLTASDKMAGDSFGLSVAMSGDGSRAIVGSPGEASDAGAAYVFVRSGTTWMQEAKLVPNDGRNNGDNFGYAVSIDTDGSRVFIGAYYHPNNGEGAAYVFTRSGTTWTQEAKLTASDKAVDDWFGYSVSMNADGSRVIAGAYQQDPSTTDAGAAYVFSRSGTTWTEEFKLVASDKVTSDYFGVSVSMNGDGSRAIVGANFSDPGGLTSAGAAYVFSRSGTTWTEEFKLIAGDKVAGDYFGTSVSMNANGSRVIVGADYSDPGGTAQAGAAYVFSRSGTTWTQDAKVFASDKQVTNYFGTSVSMNADGTRAIVGAYTASPNGTTRAGAAYVCKRNAAGTWTAP